jgi:two-component system sensor histidine kinase YesM
VPKFILQPLLENSITHGLQNENGLINISIVITEMGNDLIISVEDTGAGISGEKLDEINRRLSDSSVNVQINEAKQRHAIGIFNVNKRIHLYYGDGYGLNILCPPEGGTIARLKISKFS